MGKVRTCSFWYVIMREFPACTNFVLGSSVLHISIGSALSCRPYANLTNVVQAVHLPYMLCYVVTLVFVLLDRVVQTLPIHHFLTTGQSGQVVLPN
jgi:hypothetical protein